MKTLLEYLILALVVALVLSQLQPLLIRAAGGVSGSFGVRPLSHRCLGVTLEGAGDVSPLPVGNLEFQLGLFHFRYSLSEEDKLGNRPICMGQDVWHGE
ncbi:MAG: hypothetical protein MUO38_09445 [Anaerolineales bacterium]|nr:hypothetical protein [Anaerolineales bacterium]